MTHPLARNRGFGLLLVLAVLALAAAAAVGIARMAWAVRAETSMRFDDALAADLLTASETPIRDWLARRAARTVLPPDAASPRVAVVDQTLEAAGRHVRIRATAFDQSGMVPWGTSSPALRSILPDDVARAAARLDTAIPPGLDLLIAARASSRRIYPGAAQTASNTATFGELLATHNPPRSGARTVLNVNTAPMPLLEAVYRVRQMAGLEAIAAARAEGRHSSPGGRPGSVWDESWGEPPPTPVAASIAWAVRVDIEAGRVRRSWWYVYVEHGGGWELVQRLAIHE